MKRTGKTGIIRGDIPAIIRTLVLLIVLGLICVSALQVQRDTYVTRRSGFLSKRYMSSDYLVLREGITVEQPVSFIYPYVKSLHVRPYLEDEEGQHDEFHLALKDEEGHVLATYDASLTVSSNGEYLVVPIGLELDDECTYVLEYTMEGEGAIRLFFARKPLPEYTSQAVVTGGDASRQTWEAAQAQGTEGERATGTGQTQDAQAAENGQPAAEDEQIVGAAQAQEMEGEQATGTGQAQAEDGQNADEGQVPARASEISYVTEGSLELTFIYNIHTWGHYFLVPLGALCVLLMFLSGEPINRRVQRHRVMARISNIAVIAVTPLLLLAYVQKMLGGAFEITQYPYYLLRSLILYGLIWLVCLLAFRKLSTGFTVYVFLMAIPVLINYYVYRFRGTALTFYDFYSLGTAAEVAGEYRLTVDTDMALMMEFILLYLFAGLVFLTGAFPKTIKAGVIRLCGAVGAAAVLIIYCGHTFTKTWLVAGNFWDMQAAYRQKGFLASMISEPAYLREEAPEGYSAEAVREAVVRLREENNAQENVSQESDETSAQKDVSQVSEEAPGQESILQTSEGTASITTPDNIILIMDETLFDPDSIGAVETDTPLLPFIHSLTENTIRGKLYVPVFGAGTSDTEYEVLTGNTKEYETSSMMAYQGFTHDPEYGLASTLKAQGYRTVALHPMKAANWNRSVVYPRMQFDEFISLGNWGDEYRDKIRQYISDWSAFEKIISLYDEKEADEKLFTFMVTMQNHGGYTSENADYTPTVNLLYDEPYPLAQMCLSLLNETDQAFQMLVEHFQKVEEPTMIILFGDHQAKVEDGFYEELFGKSLSDLNAEEVQERFQTPYLIWTNYDLEADERLRISSGAKKTQESEQQETDAEVDADIETGAQESTQEETPEESLMNVARLYTDIDGAAGPDMSANYLGSVILELAGLEGAPYNELLWDLYQKYPVIGKSMVRDHTGTWYALSALPEEASKDLNLYHYFEYNEVFDRANLVEEAFVVER